MSRLPARISVVGAGINGLACAVSIQKCLPDAQVEIIAETWSPNTTSDGSAGFWGPSAFAGSDLELIRHLCAATHEHLLNLAQSPLAGELGVQQLSGYYLYAEENQDTQEENIIKSVADSYRKLTPAELARFPMAKSGHFHTTVQVDVTSYMRWMFRKFLKNGGTTVTRRLSSLKELAGHCDLVINCCGLGARDLLKDDLIVPARGQIFRVHAPWIKHFYLFKPKGNQEYTYIFPGVKNTVVGGVEQVGDWRTEIDEENSVDIWRRAQNLVPSIAKATPIKVWAGLRPTRESLRLEREELDVDGTKLKVVHNYGHGGSGITMHWGCAMEVTRLALESLGYQTTSFQHTRSKI